MNRSQSPQLFLNYRLVGWGPLIAIVCALAGWPACAIMALLQPTAFGFGYLTVLSFFGTLAMGALFWILLHHAVDAAWSVLLRRIWEHLACLLPPLIVMSLPLILVQSRVWFYKFPIGFSPSIQWLLVWGALLMLTISAQGLRRVSIKNDDSGLKAGTARRLTFAVIPCFAVAFALVSILVWMSLQGGWVSAIWPIYIFAGAALSSLAISIVIVIWILPAFNGMIKTDHFHLFGKLLFALTLFWGYVALGQYLIIWYGNLPHETAFFRIRAQGQTSWIGWILVVGHFFIPFILLLFRVPKKHPKFLAAIAAWLVVMQLVELCWIILPPSGGDLLLLVLAIITSLIAVGGTLTFIFLTQLGQSPLWPTSDHRFEECLSLVDE